MSTKAEDHQRRREELEGWPIEVTSYRIGDRHYSHVDNVSPGATIARGEGATREAAEKKALERARELLSQTKKRE